MNGDSLREWREFDFQNAAALALAMCKCYLPPLAADEALIIDAIDKHWEELNHSIDMVFAGKKIQIKKIK